MKKSSRRMVLFIVFVLNLSCYLSGCTNGEQPRTSAPAEPEVRTVVDMAGREVEVPDQINKVFSTNPPGAILLYTVDPELLVAWNYSLGEAEKRFILPQYLSRDTLKSAQTKN